MSAALSKKLKAQSCCFLEGYNFVIVIITFLNQVSQW